MMGGKLSCVIHANAVPVLPGAQKAADAFLYTAAGQRNRNHTGPFVRFKNVSFAMEEVLFDPQTSGGLLLAVSLAVTAVLILGIELLAPQILSVFHPDQGTMEIAVRNLRIEILGQIFYASFMVYNALPMGAGHTMFALGSSLLNCIVVRVILALILNHFYGLVGIFWACAIAPASSVPLGYLYERTGVWRRALVQGEES